MKTTPRLKEQYTTTIREELKKELNLSNRMQVPEVEKIVVNVGIGDALSDKGVLETVSKELALITGQRPVSTKARRAISTFKIRFGDVIGLKVTLRGRHMWEFLDRLISVVFPRTKDFRGLPVTGFDGSGNYTIGIEEQTVFPEIDPNTVTKLRGMEITIVTSTKNDAHARALLAKFDFPFIKDGEKV